MEILRRKTPDKISKEIAIHLLSYNIIRGNLAQAASLYEKIPREPSFRSAVYLVIQASKQIVGLTGNRLINTLREVLKTMASMAIEKQKRKSQPRAVKRQPKTFPLLTVPRNEAYLSR